MTDDAVPVIPKPQQLPWHESAVRHLQSAWVAQRFPHALLLHGADGLGKRELTAWVAAAVLCENSVTSLQVCGKCASCGLIAAATHPDLWWVSPLEDKQQISVDQIRAATARLTHTSYRQGYKVAVVEPAHQMTVNAANSLLKTLEEPTPRSLLILITARPSALLPTVRSRCQKVAVQGPSPQEALDWLQTETGAQVVPQLLEFAGQAPLRALQLATGQFEQLDTEMQRGLSDLLSGKTDVTQLATDWGKEKEGLPERLTWLDLWLMSVARAAIGGNADLFTFPARSPHLPSLPAALNISAVYALVDQARGLKAQLTRTALQRELAIESLLITLLQTLMPPATRT
ncbi:MAG TPA: DNA polymerase III subunit delta' [Povalibacter sp.]